MTEGGEDAPGVSDTPATEADDRGRLGGAGGRGASGSAVGEETVAVSVGAAGRSIAAMGASVAGGVSGATAATDALSVVGGVPCERRAPSVPARTRRATHAAAATSPRTVIVWRRGNERFRVMRVGISSCIAVP